MHRGYLKLWRKLLEWEWFRYSEMVHLFIYLLLSANRKESRFMGVQIERGQLVTGRNSLSEKLGMSSQTVRTCISRLKSTNEITIKSTNKFSIITLCNFETYQFTENEINQLNTSKSTNDQPATNQQLTTIKEVKKLRIKEKTLTPLSERTWKNSFWLFRKNLIIAYRSLTDKIHTDETYRRELQEANPQIDLAASLKKAMTHFWGTPTGWKWAKKNRKTETLNYTLCLINAIDKNRVYVPKENSQDNRRMTPERIAKAMEF
jgi:hypothetical protein